MKNKILTIIILVLLFCIFASFVYSYKSKYEVIDVMSADMLVLDFNRNGVADNNETVCIYGVDSFEPEPDKDYSSKLKLSKNDMINLWYLGREYGQKILINFILRLLQNVHKYQFKLTALIMQICFLTAVLV